MQQMSRKAKNRNKVLITLFLCLLLTFALVACKKNKDKQKIEPIETKETTILVTQAKPSETLVEEEQPVQSDSEAESEKVEVQDPPRSGKAYLYLTVNELEKDKLNQVFVFIENQCNRKFKASEAMRLEELVDGQWREIAKLEDKSDYTVNMNDIAQQIIDLSQYDLEGAGRQFRFFQNFNFLKSNGDVELSEEVYSQNFTVHSQARLDENEYVALVLDKTVYNYADLAQFNIRMDNASSKYVMVFRAFTVQVYREGQWVDYQLNVDFSTEDSWYINPQEQDKQSYNLRQAGLDPAEEAYRIVKPYGLFYSTASSQKSESFFAFSEPFKIEP
ncbi:MAG: hypothetical protein Q4P08_02335 [Eubacteriales bacterium]|nr:hypothetical protein [Eubacteriales bacterium]